MNTVELVTMTAGVGPEFEGRSIDDIIVGEARVSTDKSGVKLFQSPHKLLRHMILNQHWSPFGMADIGFKITTSRAIGRELLRHFSISPQEFSQRYSSPNIHFDSIELRMQAKEGSRQSSSEVAPEWFHEMAKDCMRQTKELYDTFIENGVSRESARFILPEHTTSVLYMKGSVRSWITFLNSRLHKPTAQKEITLIAEQIRDCLIRLAPITCDALFKFEYADVIPILDQVVLNKYGFRDLIIEEHKKAKRITKSNEQ